MLKSGSQTRTQTTWYLRLDGSEFGPLSWQEVVIMVKSGKLQGDLTARAQGSEAWLSLERLGGLEDYVRTTPSRSIPIPPPPPQIQIQTQTQTHAHTQTQSTPGLHEIQLDWTGAMEHLKDGNQRKSARKSLLATVRFIGAMEAKEGGILKAGITRDISSNGMLVLSNSSAGSRGTLIQIEVEPVGGAGLRPFKAEVEIVHILTDGKGFAVRFKRMSRGSHDAILGYLVESKPSIKPKHKPKTPPK